MVYPVGIPAFYFFVLNNVKEEIKNRCLPKDSAAEESTREQVLKPLRSIFDIYLPQFWYDNNALYEL